MNNLKKSAGIIWAILTESFQSEKAYIGNMVGGVASTIFYVSFYLVFLNILFAKIGNLAGYTKNDIYFMVLLAQFMFYTFATVLLATMENIINTVRTGAFDQILLRPFNKLIYLYTTSFKPFNALIISLPNIFILCVIINWHSLSISLSSVLLGLVCWLAALLILNTFVLALTYPVFTSGEATDLLGTSFSTFAICEMPFEKLPKTLQFLSFSVLAPLLSSGGATYVMLQKGPTTTIVIFSVLAAIMAVLLFHLIWRKALANYASASS